MEHAPHHRGHRRPGRRTKTDSLELLLKRIALYSSAALLLWAGWRYYRNLQDNATALDGPYQRVTVFEGNLAQDSLPDAMEESGSSEDETKAVLKALRPAGGSAPLHKGDHFRITRSADGSFQHLTLLRGRKSAVVTRQGDSFKTTVYDTPLHQVQRTERGDIRGSLWLSMSRERVPAEIIQEFTDVFQWSIDFLTETRDGDRYAVNWVEEQTPDGRVWSREVQGALYGGKRSGVEVGVLFEGAYFDEKGESLARMFLRAPLNFRRISSFFSNSRWHPVLRIRRPHHGIDYSAPQGTPVVSIGQGTVRAAGWRGGFGKTVEIRHAGGYTTLYGHLSRYGPGIRSGVHVRQGQVIGHVGSTGISTGPHLDFRIAKGGKWFNFLALKLPKATSVPKAKKAAYAALLRRRLQALGAEGL
ncbi:MAG: hypothetical protein A2X36_07250 [Elusimicrobia bacterium GWA2_69_24]|nr:MAG: hypothetical protein A2X36_07250 [Elusimicrobia bacterium GWA2_69_24]HBL16170.1 hypothetical protein [Elusimicrobiota bacterium]